ncbi:helix-turn-helix domain-containing protein [Bacteroides thetaiotaomicron]|jgi:hypothetical protein|nr:MULTISPECIES: helix-turn-helix domain-containing protein [unclassified Pseudoflavonifractor]KAB4839030.1 helix-turn-helix domain-containing protein [Bacteroides thetaiotaomicron]
MVAREALIMFEDYPDVLIPEEVAEMLRMGRGSVYNLLETGGIKGIRNGRNWRVPKLSVEQFLIQGAGIERRS